MTTIPYAHLLLVSRNTISLTALGDDLHQLNLYAVTMTNSMLQAVQLVAEEPFDLILMDVGLVKDPNNIGHTFLHKGIALPVIVIGVVAELPRITECVRQGVDDYLIMPINSALLKARIQPHLQKKRLQEQAESALQNLNELEKLADDLRLEILPLGIALSAEEDLDKLLERIIVKAMTITNADGGTLYLRTVDNSLRYAIMRTHSLGLVYGGTTGQNAPYRDIPLYNEIGEPNHKNVASYVALSEQVINIDNIYRDNGFDFSGTNRFDKQHNYRSTSCLTVPLRNSEVIGVIQLINAQEPATGRVVPFDVYHQLVAEALASLAALTLHNRRLRLSESSLLRYKQELEIGRRIQAGFFPTQLPQPQGWELVGHFKSALEVAGDFYDVFPMPYGKLGLVIGDVCDKGIAAALFMALLRSLLRASIQQHYHLRTQFTTDDEDVRALLEGKRPFQENDRAALLDIIRLINAYIGSNHGEAHIFATLFFAMLDPDTGQVVYANCGHIPPLVVDRQGVKNHLMPTGPALGLRPDSRFTIAEVTLDPDDLLFAYTDGVTEARNAQGEWFGLAYLQQILESLKGTADDVLEGVVTAVDEYTAKSAPFDDIAMLVLRRKP